VEQSAEFFVSKVAWSDYLGPPPVGVCSVGTARLELLLQAKNELLRARHKGREG
jgi:hypothetical protein